MNKKLYVGNLPYGVTEDSLRALFAQTGEVSSVAIVTDRDSGRPRGFAFVEMVDEAAARQAINQMNGKTIDDRTITVAEARPPAARYSSDSNRGGYGNYGSGNRGGSSGGRRGYGGGRRRR